jgi:hypothetical protein
VLLQNEARSKVQVSCSVRTEERPPFLNYATGGVTEDETTAARTAATTTTTTSERVMRGRGEVWVETT